MLHERCDKSMLWWRELQDCNTMQKEKMKTKKFWDCMMIEDNDIMILLLNNMCHIRSGDCTVAKAQPINAIVWDLRWIMGL